MSLKDKSFLDIFLISREGKRIGTKERKDHNPERKTPSKGRERTGNERDRQRKVGQKLASKVSEN